MKTVVFYQNKGINDRIFDPTARDNCNDPFICLKQKLNDYGYSVVLANENTILPQCEAVLFFTPPPLLFYDGLKGKLRWLKHQLLGRKKFLDNAQFYESCIKKKLQDKMVLVLWEGQSVCPSNYHQQLYAKFSRILTWNDSLVDGKKFFKFYLPIARPNINNQIIPFKDKKFLVNISINKTSNFPRELYSERLRSIVYFNHNFSNNFDLYGYGWGNNFLCYRGPVVNKADILKRYKFSLCYENLRDEPGYITEKIFDCLLAGTIPIYWGASNVVDYVDAGAFIDRRKFKNNQELADYLLSIDSYTYDKLIAAGQNYLRSEKFKLFLPENFSNIIINHLNLV